MTHQHHIVHPYTCPSCGFEMWAGTNPDTGARFDYQEGAMLVCANCLTWFRFDADLKPVLMTRADFGRLPQQTVETMAQWKQYMEDIKDGNQRQIIILAEQNMVLHISGLYAFVATDEHGNEGLAATQFGQIMMPLIGADRSRIEQMQPYAQLIVDMTGKPVRLCHFSNRTEICNLTPANKQEAQP